MRIPKSEPIGFQSLGPGSGDTNMHAPKNRNNPGTCWSRAGTLLERPGTFLGPCWDLAGILLQPSWNLPVGTVRESSWNLVEPSWNLVGTFVFPLWLRCLGVILSPKASFRALCFVFFGFVVCFVSMILPLLNVLGCYG